MRLFLAVEIPEEVRDALQAFRRTIPPEGWRFVRPEAIHLTLRFLGETDGTSWRALEPRVFEAAASVPAFRLNFEGVGVFPDARRPRVLWVGAKEDPPEGRLISLAERLEREARGAGFAPQTRSFAAHVTLARAERGGGARSPDAAPTSFGTTGARELVLFRSELGPSGARYTALERFPFRGVP